MLGTILVLNFCRSRIETVLGSSVASRISEEPHLHAKNKKMKVIRANLHLFFAEIML